MSDDIPFDKTLRSCPGPGGGIRARRAAAARQQSKPVHVQGHGELHHRARAGRDRRPGSARRSRISAALLAAVRGETVTHIFVTHTHRDHSPAVPHIKAATGALVLAEGPHRAGACAQCGRGAAARRQQRHGVPARPRARRRRGRRRRRLDNRGGDDARPYRQPHGVRLQGGQPAVFGRPCDGVGDAGGGAAGRRHERLHGFARTSSRAAPSRSTCRAMAAPCATRRASCSTISGTGKLARPRSCTGWPREKPIFRRSCGQSISVSIRGW